MELVPVIRSAVEAIRPAATAKRLELGEDFDAKVGVVRADPHRVQQVAWNILSNAVKFTPAGGRIDVRVRRDGDEVEIRVKDTGQGISEEFMPRVFDRFGQAEPTTTRTKGGLGIGLAIARQLAELHGGTIVAESAGEGKGSTFTVRMRLPAIKVGQGGESAHASRTHIADSLKGLKILIVEDESNTRDALHAILKMAGAEVTTADSMVTAIEQYRQRRLDLIISDIGLPNRDGYELIQKIREIEDGQQRTRVPAIALSAFVQDKDRRKAMESGFEQHMKKPVEPGELIPAILALKQGK
jgi:CheY-like chemotaxis protein